jgi:hypothetical protein
MPWQRITAPRGVPCAGWWRTPDKVSPRELGKVMRSSFMNVSRRHQQSDDCIAQLKPAQKLAAKLAQAAKTFSYGNTKDTKNGQAN